MDSRCKALVEQSGKMFSDRAPYMALCQDIAENFYPERADFTVKHHLGAEFNDQNMTSYPLLARRDLANSIGSMLRPRNTEWFKVSTTREDKHDHAGRMWLEEATKRQRRAMYDRKSNFARATKEGDNDYATFGQCVIELNINRHDQRFVYQCWHLRDVAWAEDAYGQVDRIDRNWSPTISMAMRMFGDRCHEKVKEAFKDRPHQTIKLLRVVMKSDLYREDKQWRHPWVSIWIDCDNHHIMEEVAIPTQGYVLPRWQTVSGSQYAYSPATIVALPDARLIQSMTRVLLEAGEKGVDPPMVAVQEAIRSDMSLYAGGVTWVDAAYDERLGDALRPVMTTSPNLAYGIEMRRDVQEMITEAFYLNKLGLPPADTRDMTAYETAQRVQEYIRQALPLFEPLEVDYNGQLCELSFDLGLRNGLFGPIDNIPQSLRGADIEFRFQSPLHEAIEQQKGQKFTQGGELLRQASELDPNVASNVDINTMFRDAFRSVGAPEAWLVDERKAAEQRAQAARVEAQEAQIEQMGQAGAAAQQVAQAASEAA